MGKPKKTQAKTEIETPITTAAMMAINPVVSKAWLDVMTESSRFVADRLQQDLETQKAILACKSPAELLQIQSEFFQTAMEQYTSEAVRLYKMMSKATEDTLKDTKTGHTRGYDDVPL